MAQESTQLEVRYEPRYCSFLKRHVWAIRTRQPDGVWWVVNCLDKDQPCYAVECAFTTSGGQWPYADGCQPPCDPSCHP